MKKIILSLLLFNSIPLLAQAPLTTANTTVGIRKSYDNEAITIANVSKGFTAAKINAGTVFQKAQVAYCVNTGAQIRVLSSGGTPTSSNGIPVENGVGFFVYGVDDVAAFRAIRTTSTSSTLDCQYSRLP